MSQGDYATIMKTLSGNLAEGDEVPAEIVEIPEDEEESEGDKAKPSEDKIGEKLVEQKAPKSPDVQSAVRFAVKFTVDEIAALLFSGSSDLVSSSFLSCLVVFYENFLE